MVSSQRRRAASALFATIALLVYAVLLFRDTSFAAGGPDSSGYLNLAKMLAQGKTRVVLEPLRTFGLAENGDLVRIFTPVGFTWGLPGTGSMAPGYPPGMAVHLALAGALGGWERAPFLVSPLAAIGCALMMFLLARELGLSNLLAFCAAAILVLQPQLVAHAMQPVSDVVATFWSIVAIWAALVALRRPGLAFLAGAAFAIGVWVRPTGVLLVVPLAIALRFRPKLLLRAAIAAAPFAMALMYYHARTYGSPFRTGYGTLGEVVTLANFIACFRVFAKWFVHIATPLLFPIGLLVVADRRVPAWHRVLLPVWFLLFLLFYCFWAPYDDWWSLRFLLPGTPALILGTLLMGRDLALMPRRGAAQWAARVAAVVLIGLMIAVPAQRLWKYHVELTDDWESIYPEAVHWAESQMERDSMVIAGSMSGAFFYYSNRFSVRADQLTDEQFQMLRAYAGSRGMRWYALLSDAEPQYHDLAQRFRGNWTLIGRHRHVAMWRLDS